MVCLRRKVLDEFVEVGRFLFDSGVVEYYSGNLSVFCKNKIYITRSGSPLPLLKPQDVLEIKPLRPLVGKPSSEYIVHRRIYEVTDLKAVAHAHPPTVVKLAFDLQEDFFVPKDNEGKLLLGRIPVLRLEKPSASPELAEAVAQALNSYPCAIIYSHGVFCGADTLKRAAGFITALEFSARVYDGTV